MEHEVSLADSSCTLCNTVLGRNGSGQNGSGQNGIGQNGIGQNGMDKMARTIWYVMAHWLRRLLSTGGSWVRLPLWPSRRDLGQVLYLQLPVRFGVKLRYSIRAVVGSASEW